MTLTYSCINRARNTVIYVLGKAKAPTVEKVHFKKEDFSITHIGTHSNKVLCVLDNDAATPLFSKLGS